MDYTHNLSFPARNLVAKHARKFNKNAVMVEGRRVDHRSIRLTQRLIDRKKRLAAGYEKHKGKK